MRPASVRVATAADLTTLIGIEMACFGDDAWSATILTQCLDDPLQEVWLSSGGEAFGIVRVVGDTADLDRIATLGPARGRGLGRDVLQALTQRAIERGATRMLLEVAEDNTSARTLYATMGFGEIHRRYRYYSGGSDAVVMERALAD